MYVKRKENMKLFFFIHDLLFWCICFADFKLFLFCVLLPDRRNIVWRQTIHKIPTLRKSVQIQVQSVLLWWRIPLGAVYGRLRSQSTSLHWSPEQVSSGGSKTAKGLREMNVRIAGNASIREKLTVWSSGWWPIKQRRELHACSLKNPHITRNFQIFT